MAIRIQDIVGGVRVAIVTCSAWQSAAAWHAVAIDVHRCSYALAIGIEHVIYGVRIAVVARGTDLARHIGAVVLAVAHAVTVAVRTWASQALAAGVIYIVYSARIAVIAGGARNGASAHHTIAIRSCRACGSGLHTKGKIEIGARVRRL